MATWAMRLSRQLVQLVRKNKSGATYAAANSMSVQRAVDGMGPDSPKIDPRAGARMVVNLSSAHVPGFCEASAKGLVRPYKNGYDLAALAQARGLSSPVSPSRLTVDAALPLPSSVAAKDVYFGAVELNGTGIRFYGDVCLVLRRDSVPRDTVVLDRNSYDLLRSPTREQIGALPVAGQAVARKNVASGWSGEWARDLGAMAAIKAVLSLGIRERRWTTGQINEAVRSDEDYLEVLKVNSFSASDLQEARVSASDAAHDALVGSRLSRRPLPRLESLIWRNRRSRAEAALRNVQVPVRIMTSSGRTRD